MSYTSGEAAGEIWHLSFLTESESANFELAVGQIYRLMR